MTDILCATGNVDKFGIGRTILGRFDINLIQSPVEIDEIQGEDPAYIIRDKARRAFEVLGKPVIVSDDSWDIPALGGFPGAYMKSVNHWFEPEDFLHLMQDKTDRTIRLHVWLAYTDGTEVRIFTNTHSGQIEREARGSYGPPIMKIAAMDKDGGPTISELYDAGRQHESGRLEDTSDAWHQLGDWLQEHRA